MLIADWSLQYQSARGIKVIFYLAFLQNEEALEKNVVYFRRKYRIFPGSKIIAPYLAQYIKNHEDLAYEASICLSDAWSIKL
jgi:hypothetical protein